jgi:hypothetical protein
MGALFVFLPWIVQSLLSPFSMTLALSVSLSLSIASLLRHKCLMEWVSFLFFLASFVASFFLEDTVFHDAMSLLSTTTLCFISWGSLLLKQPFTLQYAKAKVPESYHTVPLFLKINTLMTTFFGVLFSIEAVLKVARLFWPLLLPYTVFFYFCHVCMVLFIPWFPGWYRNRALILSNKAAV